MPLKNLSINNFRVFKEFQIQKLSRINLIVGKNNTGKSCLLEAIGVYNSLGDPNFLSQIIEYRGELWGTNEDSYDDVFENHPIRHLFFGHKITKLDEPGISIGPIDIKNKVLQIRPRAYRSMEDESGEMIKKPVNQKELFEDQIFDYEIILEMAMGDTKRAFRLDQDIRRSFQRFIRGIPRFNKYEYEADSQLVPANGLSGDDISSLWDSIALTELENSVIQSLMIIEKNVENIAFVQDKFASSRSSNRIPILKLKNSSERVSLKSMGDGMTRIFDIILSLVNSKNGVLLIDEFENGLHWSIHSKVWELVFKLAKNLNVQVFITTHSKDCVNGFFVAWKSSVKDGSFHRLEKSDDNEKVIPFSYDHETLHDALNTHTEVR